MNTNNKPLCSFRDPSPCMGCTERFTACHDRCPKDERGENGIKRWKTDREQVMQKRTEYLRRRSEDKRRGDY